MILSTFILVLWIGCAFAGLYLGPYTGDSMPSRHSSTDDYDDDDEPTLEENIKSLKYTTKSLSGELEKWNNLFLTSLEPRMSSAAASLASIDSNVNNLQERAHVWDTFQLHITAWNDQLATLDRKIDIINKGQEKILSLESKLDAIAGIGNNLDNVLSKINNIEESLSGLKEQIHSKRHEEKHEILFEQFAGRGILSSIQTIEKKVDTLLHSQQNLIISKQGDERPRLVIKCNTRVNGSEENEEEIDVDGSGEIPFEIKTIDSNNNTSNKINDNINLHVSDSLVKIENVSQAILSKENEILQKIDRFYTNSTEIILSKVEKRGVEFTEHFNNIMDSYFSEQKAHFESLLLKYLPKYKNSDNQKVPSAMPLPPHEETSLFFEPTKKGCEDLDKANNSGIYVFGSEADVNAKNRSFNKKFCLVRDDGFWTILQKRDNFPTPQNFNLSWFDYKHGFGNLHKDFWFGNDFISKFSLENDLVLRIELEDFIGNTAWAEYSIFKVFSEADDYRLIIGRYKGNASDSFSSHNNTFFSTFDRKNDQAPKCCPCASSYGGGWWFNSCFETNLNGIYFKEPYNNGHFGGIIWETWLGDYSLKKSIMMAKSVRRFTLNKNKTLPYPEEP